MSAPGRKPTVPMPPAAAATPRAPGPAPRQVVPGLQQLEVQSLFPTPVAVAMLAEGPAINAALKPIVLARAEAAPSTQHSNLGGWQSTWDMLDWGGPAIAKVVDAGKALASRLTADRQGRPVNVAWKVNCWANVNRGGHGNEFHSHPGAYWSASYYVDDGGIADDPSLGGEFEIQDPRGVAPVMYAPLLTFNMPGGITLGSTEQLRPRAGMIVMFPSWLQHAVRPYTGTQTRISIAFNLSV